MSEKLPVAFIGENSFLFAYGEYEDNMSDMYIESASGSVRWYHLFLPFLPKPRVTKTIKNIKEIPSYKIPFVSPSDDIKKGEYAVESYIQIFFYDIVKNKPFNLGNNQEINLIFKNMESIIRAQKLEISDLRKEVVDLKGKDLFMKKAKRAMEQAVEIHEAGTSDTEHRLREEIAMMRKK